MTQQDRDRLVALKKAKKGLITQRQAAEEIGQSERHVRRPLPRVRRCFRADHRALRANDAMRKFYRIIRTDESLRCGRRDGSTSFRAEMTCQLCPVAGVFCFCT